MDHGVSFQNSCRLGVRFPIHVQIVRLNLSRHRIRGTSGGCYYYFGLASTRTSLWSKFCEVVEREVAVLDDPPILSGESVGGIQYGKLCVQKAVL